MTIFGLPQYPLINSTPNFFEYEELDKSKTTQDSFIFKSGNNTQNRISFNQSETKKGASDSDISQTPTSITYRNNTKTNNEILLSNGKTFKTRVQENNEPSEDFLKIERRPILENIQDLAKGFSSTIGTPDSVIFYSSLKDSLKDLWQYISLDEPLALSTTALESVLRYNKWSELNQKQASEILKTVHVLFKEGMTRDVVEPTIAGLHNIGINMFHYAET